MDLLSNSLKMIKVEENNGYNLSVELILIASQIAFGVYGLNLLTRKNATDEYISSQNFNT